jgi:type II secretory pathway pseudopilin PulG
MNNEQFQSFGIKHMFLFAGLLGLLGFLVLPSWSQHRTEDKLMNAQRQAEVLGYQVFEIYHEAALKNTTLALEKGSRAPASVTPNLEDLPLGHESGSIGGDPWGQPYRYKILNAGKDLLKVQIWSAGPNKIFETSDKPGIAADLYLGDDVGIVLSMAPKAMEN